MDVASAAMEKYILQDGINPKYEALVYGSGLDGLSIDIEGVRLADAWRVFKHMVPP